MTFLYYPVFLVRLYKLWYPQKGIFGKYRHSVNCISNSAIYKHLLKDTCHIGIWLPMRSTYLNKKKGKYGTLGICHIGSPKPN